MLREVTQRKVLRCQSKGERRKYRSELVKKNREMGKKGDGLDVSHQKGGKFILEKASKNRARK